MSLPSAWARLPGPADLLEAIGEDLRDRSSVIVGLPEELPGSKFAVELADLVKRHGLGRWHAVRSDEARERPPSVPVTRWRNSDGVEGVVLWVDATGADEAANKWTDYAWQSVGMDGLPRMCIAMRSICADSCQEEKRLRRRIWGDFVTALDGRVLAERHSRGREKTPEYTALKSALIAELAHCDLSIAERLLKEPLEKIIKAGGHPPERIWAAQVSVLFPIIERERRRLLKEYRQFWKLPHTRKDGTRVECLGKLSIGDMEFQAPEITALASERQRLVWLRRVRNALAHSETIPWATLKSGVALQIADFREQPS